jgi:hypothetical protein
MVRACALRDGVGMVTSHEYNDSIAASTFELRRAAEHFQQRADAPGALAALPLALADVEKALERLATGAVKAAEAVEALSPEARALRWHLFHVAARLRGAEGALPETRRWARELLAQDGFADDEEPSVLSARGVARRDALAR